MEISCAKTRRKRRISMGLAEVQYMEELTGETAKI
jgi:hypothetical protein